jgi:outer membrane receptor for ferrienterochelin and colicin
MNLNIRISPKRVLFFSTLILLSISTFSQKLVKFSGTVIDVKTKSFLVGAIINVSNSQKNILTDIEGRFIFEIKQGVKFEIEISSLGFDKKILSDVDPVADNGITVFLSPRMKEMEEVVVRSTGRKESVASLYIMQRNSSSIQDGISAESIKKSPDKNTGEVIRRVSGASVQDNKFVIIRGLNERYNVAMLNNNILPSTEPDKKAFSFDIIPASAIDNLIIYKTPTADLPGDFSGGLVKIVTKDYPSKAFTEVSISTSANSMTTGKEFFGTSFNGKYDNFGFFDKLRNVPAEYEKNRGSSFISLPNAAKQQITKQFPASYHYRPMATSLPSFSVGVSGGNTILAKSGAKIGMLYMLNYGNGRKASEKNRYDYLLNGDLLYDNATSVYDQKNNLSGLINLAYSKGKNKFTFKTLFNNDYTNSLGLRTGYDISNRPTRFETKSYNSEFSSNGLVSLVLDGTHGLSKKLNFDWSVSASDAYKNQPDQKIVSFRSPNDIKGSYYLKIGNENSPEIRNAGRIYSTLDEKIYNLSFNFNYNFQVNGVQQKFKFGSMNFYRDRSTVVDALGYASLDFRGVTIYESKLTDYSTLFSNANIDAFKLTLASIGNNSTSYTANAMLNAGYLMYDGKFSDKLKLTAGARIENYNQKLLAKNQSNIELQNLDVLPSLLLTYAIGSRTNLRFAASESVNRPEFRELASYSVFDYENFVVIRGNPNLKRSLIKNADFRFETFPATGEILSASIFYKSFENPIEQINAGNDVLSYQNADKATTYGSEFEIRKKLDFFGTSFLDRFTFYSNLAYILGNVTFKGAQINTPLQGQSPYIINASLSYASSNEEFSVSALYNKVGPRLKFRAVNGAAFNIFEMPRDLIDFQLSKKLMKGKAEIKFTVSDILAQPYRWFYKFDSAPANNNFDSSKDKFINSSYLGTGLNLGIKINL